MTLSPTVPGSARLRNRPSLGILLAFGVLVIGVSLISGLVLALGVYLLDMLLIGAMCGVVLLFLPMHSLFALFLGISFLIIGPVTYFAGFNQILWIPYLLGALLFIRFPIELGHLRFSAQSADHGFIPDRRRHSLVMTAFWLYMLVIVVSLLVNLPPLLQTFTGIRNYVFLWSVMLILGFTVSDFTQFERIWKFLIVVAIVQLPFVLFQHIYVVRILDRNWDAVVGTFNGYISGEGGTSGSMATFLTSMLVYAMVMWRDKFWSGRHVWWFAFVIFCTLLMAETKIIFVLIPLAFLIVFWKRLFYKPLQGALILGSVAIAMSVSFLAYQQMFWGEGLDLENEVNWSSKLGRTFEYLLKMETDAGYVDLDRGEVSRIGGVYVWIQEHRARYSLPQAIIGHGPAASRTGAFMGQGTVAANYRFVLTINSVSAIAWDFGILGLAAFCFLFIAGVYRAVKLSRRETLPPKVRSTLSAIAVILFLDLLLLVYKPEAIDVPQAQIFIALLFGQVLFWDLASEAPTVSKSPKKETLSKNVSLRRKTP